MIKVICDGMLGTLVRWMRIFGIDTLYAGCEINDEQILGIAQEQSRTIISRDKELLERAIRLEIPVISIQSTDLDSQLVSVFSEIDVDETVLLTRCTVCNGALSQVEKEEVKKDIPKKIQEIQEEFWKCTVCGKVYWHGSHVEKMMEKYHWVMKNRNQSI